MSKQVVVRNGKKPIYFEEFKSLNEFYGLVSVKKNTGYYITETFDTSKMVRDWSKTKNFEEAMDLAINGWTDGSVELTQGVKKLSLNERKTIRKQFFDVCGFQASVPLYLHGVPTNMINCRPVAVKNKIITMNKMIGFTGNYTAESMLRENIKTLALIDDIEKSGYRVNLNVLYCSGFDHHYRIVKIRAKSANEKLNISKLAFPLCHPSMHRRLYFNYLNIRQCSYESGRSQFSESLFERCKESGQFKGEYILPQTLGGNVKTVADLDNKFKVV